MSKYICQICGYAYDEEVEKVRFEDLPAEWTCPLCGAAKQMFKKAEAQSVQADVNQTEKQQSERLQSAYAEGSLDDMREMSAGELAAVFSNLARGCEKQYKAEESKMYSELAAYYTSRTEILSDAEFAMIVGKINSDLENEFTVAKNESEYAQDRGAKRVLTWSEKVAGITQSILARYKREGNAMLENTKIWVCDICGFIYIGDVPPAVCPICKVPNFKILEVARV